MVVNIFTYGGHFFTSRIHIIDFIIVAITDGFYFVEYCTDIFEEEAVQHYQVVVDIIRSALRMVRLIVVVVRLNDAFTGPMESLHKRMRAVHRANSKLAF